MLAELLVEVAEVRACKASCHVPPARPFEFCQEKLALMQVQELKGLRMQHQPRTLNFLEVFMST